MLSIQDKGILRNLLARLEKARERWCAQEVDDGEEMWMEYPELLEEEVPRLRAVVANLDDTAKEDQL